MWWECCGSETTLGKSRALLLPLSCPGLMRMAQNGPKEGANHQYLIFCVTAEGEALGSVVGVRWLPVLLCSPPSFLGGRRELSLRLLGAVSGPVRWAAPPPSPSPPWTPLHGPPGEPPNSRLHPGLWGQLLSPQAPSSQPRLWQLRDAGGRPEGSGCSLLGLGLLIPPPGERGSR